MLEKKIIFIILNIVLIIYICVYSNFINIRECIYLYKMKKNKKSNNYKLVINFLSNIYF